MTEKPPVEREEYQKMGEANFLKIPETSVTGRGAKIQSISLVRNIEIQFTISSTKSATVTQRCHIIEPELAWQYQRFHL